MRIILTTILMLVCLVAYSATPSYSNFSSNQFAPSGTYTVTVKNQPLLTNIVEHAQLSLTNPAFADSLVYMTNMRSLTGLTNTMMFVSTYGPKTQFAWTTNGIGLTNTVMMISNGTVGILKAPTTALDVSGVITANGVSYGGIGTANVNGIGQAAGTYFKTTSRFSIIGLGAIPGMMELVDGGNGISTNGAAFVLLTGTNNNWESQNTISNTVIYSQGTNLFISDGITANSSNVATMQFSFQTSGTPVMVISNGMVGIGKASPTVPLDVVGQANISGSALVGADIRAGTSSKIYFQNNAGMKSPAPSYLTFYEPNEGTNGCAFVMPASTNLLSTHETVTNTVIGSQGTRFMIGDPVASTGYIVQQNASTYLTDAVVTNLLNVPLGKTNGMFVNTNGTLSYLWSDGWTVYGKPIAP